MRRYLLLGTLALLAGPLLAADSGKDDIAGAAKNLAAKQIIAGRPLSKPQEGGFAQGPPREKRIRMVRSCCP